MSKSEHFDTVTLERLIVLGEIYRLDGTTLAPIGTTAIPFTNGLATAGETLIASSSATTHHRLKGLVAGAGISLAVTGDDVTISNTGDSDYSTFGQQAGSGGASLVGTDTSGGAHYVRGVAGIEGVSAAVVGEDVVVRLDPATTSLQDEATAAGASLVGSNSAAPTYRVRGIDAGPGIAVSVVGEDVVVNVDPLTALLEDEATSVGASLVGSNSSAPTYRIRGIAAGTGIGVSVVGEDVVVDAAALATGTDHVELPTPLSFLQTVYSVAAEAAYHPSSTYPDIHSIFNEDSAAADALCVFSMTFADPLPAGAPETLIVYFNSGGGFQIPTNTSKATVRVRAGATVTAYGITSLNTRPADGTELIGGPGGPLASGTWLTLTPWRATGILVSPPEVIYNIDAFRWIPATLPASLVDTFNVSFWNRP